MTGAININSIWDGTGFLKKIASIIEPTFQYSNLTNREAFFKYKAPTGLISITDGTNNNAKMGAILAAGETVNYTATPGTAYDSGTLATGASGMAKAMEAGFLIQLNKLKNGHSYMIDNPFQTGSVFWNATWGAAASTACNFKIDLWEFAPGGSSTNWTSFTKTNIETQALTSGAGATGNKLAIFGAAGDFSELQDVDINTTYLNVSNFAFTAPTDFSNAFLAVYREVTFAAAPTVASGQNNQYKYRPTNCNIYEVL